ncbi:monofunctional biosynthetic peptidoglycan transglycosylase [Haemophilus parainfluenzae]|uniref:Biosynthetic peptidoglycan transglycosylase n=1 Tax=Haemophilus parainfluenzae TaxID=729 RepID=A0AAQ0H087_HAEPA|nr:monofunctional biosynthetic peptidoglycan transglycosylase [Haemophilus parainfluenzae]
MKKTKRILTALLPLFRPSWWKKNWQRVAWHFSLAILAFFVCFRFIPVPFSAYMAQQKIGHLLQLDFSYSIKYDWVSLDEISPNMQLAVIAAEDQKFPHHWGFDFEAIQKAFKFNEKSHRTRGASTISQQTAKNLVLWHGQSWFRKGLEVPTTALMEIFWSKERILEVYLNIAEFGNGIFGVEAASRYYFKKSAKNLTQSEAALLAAVLPNPIIYKVNKPSALVRKKQSWIMGQMNGLGLNYLKEM